MSDEPSNPDPFELLALEQDLVPDHYQASPGFAVFETLLARRDPRTVEALIAVATEEGHYFSDEFWIAVASAADGVGATEAAATCRAQIERNASELDFPVIHGWTQERIDVNRYVVRVATCIRERRAAERRSRDKVDDLLREDGVHLVEDGRCGTIYLVEDGELAEIGYELAGVPELDVLIDLDDITHTALPGRRRLSVEERAAWRSKLAAWLDREGIRYRS